MEPHLYLTRGKKKILLVRYFDKFHFIVLDHRMHHQPRKWLLACPRTEEEMDRWHISRSTIAVKYVRGIAAGGTGRGMVVQFYLKEGKRRYELGEDCDLTDMSALCTINVGVILATRPRFTKLIQSITSALA